MINVQIPLQLIPLLDGNRPLARITATWLLLKALLPSGRFITAKKGRYGRFAKSKAAEEVMPVANACGFESIEGFDNHITGLVNEGLMRYVVQHGYRYCVLVEWSDFKKKFGYEQNFKRDYYYNPGQVNSTEILLEMITLSWERQKQVFYNAAKKNIETNPEKSEILKTVCGSTSLTDLHQCQLKLFREGIPAEYMSWQEDDLITVYQAIHGKQRPSHAKGDHASRFLVKGDTHVSTGYFSQVQGYKNQNGICYRKKQMIKSGRITSNRREYKLPNKFRTTEGSRSTALGTVYWSPYYKCPVLRLNDEIIFHPPAAVQQQPVPVQKVA